MRLYAEERPRQAARKFLNRQVRRLSKINARIRAIHADREMSRQEKRKALNELYKVRNAASERAVKAVREAGEDD